LPGAVAPPLLAQAESVSEMANTGNQGRSRGNGVMKRFLTLNKSLIIAKVLLRGRADGILVGCADTRGHGVPTLQARKKAPEGALAMLRLQS
jgi:hypothetical protein